MNGLSLPTCLLCDQEVHIHHLPDGTTWMKGHRARPLNGRVCDACHPLILALRFAGYAAISGTHFEDLCILGKAERASYDKTNGDEE